MRSKTCGVMSMSRSNVFEAGGMTLSIRTLPSLTIRKPIGSTLTPAPLPQPTPFLFSFIGNSDPPLAKAKLTRESGMSVISSGVVIGSPTTVFVSTISLILLMVAVMTALI